MKYYKEKPKVVSAVYYTGDNDSELDAICGTAKMHFGGSRFALITVYGISELRPGSYVVREENGDLYLCESSIFQVLFEPIDSERFQKKSKIIPGLLWDGNNFDEMLEFLTSGGMSKFTGRHVDQPHFSLRKEEDGESVLILDFGWRVRPGETVLKDSYYHSLGPEELEKTYYEVEDGR